MAFLKTNKTVQKDIEYQADFKKNIESNLSITKNIESMFDFFAEQFAKIFGIGLSATIVFVASIYIKINKMLNINVTTSFLSNMTFLVKKKLAIDVQYDINATMLMLKRVSMSIDSSVEFILKGNAILESIDNLTLGELDILTLEEVGFGNGVNFILIKSILISSQIDITSTMNLSMYYYTLLLNLDTLTLGDLDSLTLLELYRTLIP